MKVKKLLTGVFLAGLLVVSLSSSIYAVESETSTRKSAEEIEAHKAELRAQKAQEIEERRAEYEAQKAERQAEQESLKEEYTEQKAEREQEREETQEQRQAEIQERIAERVSEFADNLDERVLRYYERLSIISGKIAARMSEIQSQGVDVSEASEKLAEADAALEEALLEAQALVEEIRSYEVTDRDSLGELISMVRDTNNPFKEVLEMYKEVVTLLREAVAAARSSTDEVTE